MKKETEQKIAQLQVMEQNMQNSLNQKQTFQSQLIEIENALKELENAKENPYKIVGNIMIKAEKKSLKEELQQKKELAEVRIKNIEKQEKQFKEKMQEIQKEVMQEIEKEKK